MKTKWTLRLMLGAFVLAPAVAGAQALERKPMVVGGLTGNMHIFQATPWPCDDVEGDVPVIGGRFDIAPAEGFDAGGGNRRFVMTQGRVDISPFMLSVECYTYDETHDYTALSVEVARAVSFVGVPAGPGVYTFSIPPGQVLLHEAATKNGAPEIGDKYPAAPVTGTIDLGAGTVSMQVVLGMTVDAGILGDFDGSLTTDVYGTITFPDTDGDGILDRTDTCPMVPNSSQRMPPSPYIKAPKDATLPSCQDTKIGRPFAADVCESRPLVAVWNDAPHPYPLGSTLVTWSAEDSVGRVRTSAHMVTIDDTTPPVFTSLPGNVQANDCGPINVGLPTASDDCGGSPTLGYKPIKFSVGTTAVVWKATDISGNFTVNTQQSVTIVDQVPPQVQCTPASGHPPGFFLVSALDHCKLSTLRLGKYAVQDGETIRITPASAPGVRYIGKVMNIRYFEAGPGAAVIVATDPSANTASDACY